MVLAFFGGAGLILYGACWLLVPEDGRRRAAVDLDERSRTVALVVLGVIAALALVGDSWGGYWFPWPLAVIGLVAFVVARLTAAVAGAARAGRPPVGGRPQPGPAPVGRRPRRHRDRARTDRPRPAGAGRPSGDRAPPRHRAGRTGGLAAAAAPPAPKDPRKRGPILFWFTLPLIAVAEGVLGIVDVRRRPVADSAYPALALGVIAADAARRLGHRPRRWADPARPHRQPRPGRRHRRATAGTASATYDARRRRGEVADTYYIEAGELVVDLTEVSDPEDLDGRTIELSGDVGRIEVIVPEGMDVEVTATMDGPGGYDLFGMRGRRHRLEPVLVARRRPRRPDAW